MARYYYLSEEGLDRLTVAMVNTNRGLDEKDLVDLVYLKLNISMHQNTVRDVLKRSRPAFKDTIKRFFHVLGLEFGLKDVTPAGDENHLTTRLNPLMLRVSRSSALGAIMSYPQILEFVLQKQSEGYGVQCARQSNNTVVLPPTENLTPERMVMNNLDWVGFDFGKLWRVSGQEENLRKVQALKPGESILEFEETFLRLPRLVEGIWKSDLCRYRKNFICFEFLDDRVRIDYDRPDDWEIVRQATQEEVEKLKKLMPTKNRP